MTQHRDIAVSGQQLSIQPDIIYQHADMRTLVRPVVKDAVSCVERC